MKKFFNYILTYVSPIFVNVVIVFSLIKLSKSESYGLGLILLLVWFALNTIAIPVFTFLMSIYYLKHNAPHGLDYISSIINLVLSFFVSAKGDWKELIIFSIMFAIWLVVLVVMTIICNRIGNKK